MSYENSLSCKLMATTCVCCGRKLVRVSSIQAYMGPDCGALYWVENPVGADTAKALEMLAKMNFADEFSGRTTAAEIGNKVVYLIAHGSPEWLKLCRVLLVLGYTRAATKIVSRLSDSKVTVLPSKDESNLDVKIRFEDSTHFFSVVSALRSLGAKFDDHTKTYGLRVAQRNVLWDKLRSTAPRGTVVIGKESFSVIH